MSVWLIQDPFDPSGAYDELAIEQGLATFELSVPFDLAKLPKQALAKEVIQAYPDRPLVLLDSLVWDVLNLGDISKNDIAIRPLASRQSFAVGIVTGRYRFQPRKAPGARHGIPVRWIKTDVPIAHAEKAALAWWWYRILTRVEQSTSESERRIADNLVSRRANAKLRDPSPLRNLPFHGYESWLQQVDALYNIQKALRKALTATDKSGLDVSYFEDESVAFDQIFTDFRDRIRDFAVCVRRHRDLCRLIKRRSFPNADSLLKRIVIRKFLSRIAECVLSTGHGDEDSDFVLAYRRAMSLPAKSSGKSKANNAHRRADSRDDDSALKPLLTALDAIPQYHTTAVTSRREIPKNSSRLRSPKVSVPAIAPRDYVAWLFQCHPRNYDLASLADQSWVGSTQDWFVQRLGGRMRPGDPFVAWLAGKMAGIYALGEIASYPFDDEGEQVITLRFSSVFHQPVLRTVILAHPVLSQMMVMRTAQGSVFGLTQEQWDAISDLGDTDAIASKARAIRRAPEHARN